MENIEQFTIIDKTRSLVREILSDPLSLEELGEKRELKPYFIVMALKRIHQETGISYSEMHHKLIGVIKDEVVRAGFAWRPCFDKMAVDDGYAIYAEPVVQGDEPMDKAPRFKRKGMGSSYHMEEWEKNRDEELEEIKQ